MALTACITPPVSYGPVLCFHRPRLRDCGPAACFLRTFFSKTNYCKRCLLSQRPQHATPLHTSSDSLLRRTPQSSEKRWLRTVFLQVTFRTQAAQPDVMFGQMLRRALRRRLLRHRRGLRPTDPTLVSQLQSTNVPACKVVERTVTCEARNAVPQGTDDPLSSIRGKCAESFAPRGPLLCLMLPDRWAPLLPLPRPSGQDHSLPCGGSGRGVDVFPARKP